MAKASAATLEEQAKTLEQSVMTVDQRRKAAIKDIKVNVLQVYRDSLIINSVETKIGEIFDRTARVDVTVNYSFDFDKANIARINLSKYITTDTDKARGVEPYGMIYANVDDCVGINCTVNQQVKKLMKWSTVGVGVTFMGIPGVHPTMDMTGHLNLKPGTVTIQFDVPKSKIKGDPKPVVTARVYDIHWCPNDPENDACRYTIQK